MSRLIITIEPWDGHHGSFPMFLERARTAAIQHEYVVGTLTHYVYTEAEYNSNPYVRRTLGVAEGANPPLYTVLPQAAVPVGTAAAPITLEVMLNYTAQRKDFDEQEEQVYAFQAAFIKALPPSAIAYIEGVHNTKVHNIQLQTVITDLRAHYGTITPESLGTFTNKLKIPYTPDKDISEFLLSHLLIHNELALNQVPLAEHEKVRFLQEALTPSGQFAQIFTLFNNANRTVASRTFAELSSTIKHNKDAIIATSQSLGYTASATTTQSPPTIQTLLAEITSLRSQIQSAAATANAPQLGPPPSQYCWTHGLGYHAGAQCLNPAADHQSHATNTNRMGGSTRIVPTRTLTTGGRGNGGRGRGRGGRGGQQGRATN